MQKQAFKYQTWVTGSRSDVSADCEPVAAENLWQVALHHVQRSEAVRPGEADGGRCRRGPLLDGAVHGGGVVAHPAPDIQDPLADAIKPVHAM